MELHQVMDITVNADSKWNEDQRFFVEKGFSYRITADTNQIWYDKHIPSNVQGTTGGVVNRLGTILRMKRNNSAKWMTLLCSLDKNKPYLEVGSDLNYHCDITGYLYFFANDAWNFYGNNSGFVKVKIERCA